MPAERYYYPSQLSANEHIHLEDEEAHHMIRVMRARVGDTVELVNGKGILAEAQITNLSKVTAELKVIEIKKQVRSPAPIIIAQSLPKLNRIDVIVEKGTELGMTELWFYPGDLSEKKEVSSTQIKRFANLSISAMKQCGCLWLPIIQYKPSLDKWTPPNISGFFGDVDPQAPTLASRLNQNDLQKGIIIYIGPEKGFSPSEEHQLKRLGAVGISLHKNILRTDTAPLCALSQIALMNLKT